VLPIVRAAIESKRRRAKLAKSTAAAPNRSRWYSGDIAHRIEFIGMPAKTRRQMPPIPSAHHPTAHPSAIEAARL